MAVTAPTASPTNAPTTRRRHPLLAFTVRRIGAGLVTLLVVSMLVFAACQVLPGDAASVILGRQATGQQLRQLRTEMGINRPVVVRYADWVSDLARGDLGNSAAGYAQGGRCRSGA